MSTTIKIKNGSGVPTAGDLVKGELAIDLTNRRLYTENAAGTVVELGNSANWDTAYSWGNHAAAGYITSVGSFTLDQVTTAGATTTNVITTGGLTTTGDVTTAVVSIGLWEIKLDGSDLRFTYNGTDRMRLTTTGDLIVGNDITAFGTP